MPHLRTAALLLAVALFSGTASAESLKVLYITGGGYHDYPAQSKLISEGLEARGDIKVTVKTVEGGLKAAVKHPAYEGPNWADGYDVVVHNVCNSAFSKDSQWVEHIAAPHRAGTPGVFLHCTMHCFRPEPTGVWQALVGVTSVAHEAHSPITVTRVRHHHPVIRSFPRQWTTPAGELYRIDKVDENTHVLATGVSGENIEHPVIWVGQFGKGRTFGTTLGHHNETVATDVYLNLLTRGVLWSAGRLESAAE